MSTPLSGSPSRPSGSSPGRKSDLSRAATPRQPEFELRAMLPSLEIRSSPKRKRTYSSDQDSSFSSPDSPIVDLPPNVQKYLLEAQLSPQDAVNLSSTCTRLHRQFIEHEVSILSRTFQRLPHYDEVQTIIDEIFKIGQTVSVGSISPPTYSNIYPDAFMRIHVDANLVVDAFLDYFTGPHEDSQWRCDLGICYQNRPDYSPSAERARLFQGFLFIKLCTISYGSPSLTARCLQTICNLPCLDAWFINYMAIGIFEDRLINESQALALGMLDPNINYGEDDRYVSDWTEVAKPEWRHVLDITDEIYTDEHPERKTNTEEALDNLAARKAEGCNCEHVTFLSPETATGEWLPVFLDAGSA